ncbi:hypothetical protein [Micromonospora radicis]|uniref:hypothetical protein n=1 Tax=Micromonospora radicis TaxID=1894971 RepID=UPI0011C49505|nr:hypothetical protein [Micromonospora radicis]
MRDSRPSDDDEPTSPVRLAVYAAGTGVIAVSAGKGLGDLLFPDSGTARMATLVVMMLVVGGVAGVLADPVLSAISAARRRHRR